MKSNRWLPCVLLSLILLAACQSDRPGGPLTATLSPTATELPEPLVAVATSVADGPILPVPRVDLELAALTGGYVQSLAQEGDHAYLGVDKRVWVLNVADPQQPRVVVVVSDPFPGFVLDLAAAGDLLAVRDERGAG